MWIGYFKAIRRLIRIIGPATARKRRRFFKQNGRIDFYQVPIFIVSYNRLTYLENLVKRLRQMGYKNINIIDNDSSYPPLLDYYKKTDCKVFRMTKNYGHMVFWESVLFKKYRKDLYVVTDPDVMPVENCPDDFVEVFYGYLRKYAGIRKAGFSLRIDDIPEDAPLHDEVIAWEKQFYHAKIPFMNAYVSDIDTTLALYTPDWLDSGTRFLSAVRTGEPYQARHLPWYKMEEEATEEQIYYAEHRANGFWDEVSGERTGEGLI